MKQEIKELKDLEKFKHKNKMLEIKTEKEAKLEFLKLDFDYKLQLQRIKSSEIRKNFERKRFC